LRAWVNQFLSSANERADALGMDAAELAGLVTMGAEFDAATESHVAQAAAARAATENKDAMRTQLKRALRTFVNRVQVLPGMTDTDRQAMGIAIRDVPKRVPAEPGTRPVVHLQMRQRLQHEVHFFDESSGTRSGRPRGMRGAEVWVKVGGDVPPVSLEEMRFVDLATRSPMVVEFDTKDAGGTAWYWVRWVNTQGEKGPFGAVTMGTIA